MHLINGLLDFEIENVSRGASGENGQNVGGGGREGHSNTCRSAGSCVRQRGKILQPVVMTVLQGKGPCGKEAFLLT